MAPKVSYEAQVRLAVQRLQLLEQQSAPADLEVAEAKQALLRVPPATSMPKCWGTGYPHKAVTMLSMSCGLGGLKQCLNFNRRVYATRHGLEYCEFTKAPTRLSVNFCWQKIVAIQSLLRTGRPAVFYVDGDALVLNMSLPVQQLMGQYATKDFIFAADYNACDRSGPNPPAKNTLYHINEPTTACLAGWSRPVSGGIFVVRNSLRARRRLNYIWTRGAFHRKRWGDGGSGDNSEFNKWRHKWHSSFEREAVSVPQQLMNSMRKVYLSGDFVYHQSGGGLASANFLRDASTSANPAKYAFLANVCIAHTVGSGERRLALEDALEDQTAVERQALGWVPLHATTEAHALRHRNTSARIAQLARDATLATGYTSLATYFAHKLSL